MGFTCIFFSAKYCEKDSRGPTAQDIFILSNKQFTAQQVIRNETNVLQVLNWDIMLSSPIDFLNVYLALGILFSNDRVPVPQNPQEMDVPNSKTLEYVRKYCEFFADMCLQEYEF